MGDNFNFPVEIEGLERIIDTKFDEAGFRKWVVEHFNGHDIQPRDYQIDSAISILKNRLTTSEIATSSGKTLITFLVYGYLKYSGKLNRMLVIVPNTTLVMQLNDDFEDYNKGKLNTHIRMVYGGAKDNDPKADIIVGTFQSLSRKTIEYYKGIDVVCVDECLHPDSLISMSDGTCKKITEVKIGDMVETVNQSTGDIQSRKVDYVYENLSHEDMYEIETENGKILKLTGNHKVMLTDRSWKRVDQLTENDELFDI